MPAKKKPKTDGGALKAMRGYYTEYRSMPSLGELAGRMHCAARSWAYTCCGRLETAGFIKVMLNGKMIPTDRFFTPDEYRDPDFES